MIYHRDSQTIIEVAANPVSDERLAELASMKGHQTNTGGFVAQVAVVFVDPDLADAHLPQVRRFGLELRAAGPDGETVLHKGTRFATGPEPEGGILLPVLREETWPHLETTAHRRLLAGANGSSPWVTFGIDTPTQLERVGPDELERRALDDIEAEALRNLAARKPEIVESDGVVQLTDEYAPEMILLPELMLDIGKRLGAELFAVSVPQQGTLLAVPATGNVAALCKLARDKFDSSKHRRISPVPILIAQGRPVGFVSQKASPDTSVAAKEARGDATQALADALDKGDYPRALEAYRSTDHARTETGKATEAFLMSMANDHLGAAAQIATCRDADLIAAIVRGERERALRWMDTNAAGKLPISAPLSELRVYSGLAVALLKDDATRVDTLMPEARKISSGAGEVIYRDRTTKKFRSIIDSDDAIGSMLETYHPTGLLYVPFSTIRALRFHPPRNFIDKLVFPVEIDLTDGDDMVALVPLLYALSTTAESASIRAGRMTTWRYVGNARRALGQRDFVLDGGTMVGMQGIAAIEFDHASQRPSTAARDGTAEDAPPPSKPWWKFW